MTAAKNTGTDAVRPAAGSDRKVWEKPDIKNPDIQIGEYTCIADDDFEEHVTHHHAWNGDRLIIGRFCQIETGVTFVMNGAEYQTDTPSAYPFHLLEGGEMASPEASDLTHREDTVIGNDVWIGRNAVIMPGVYIGDGAMIRPDSVVDRHIEPYAIAAGNPAVVHQMRFDDELIELLREFRWWDKDIEEIKELVPLLTCPDLAKVKEELFRRLG